MSLPYCMTVMARNGDFRVSDLETSPHGVSEDQYRRVEVVSNAGLGVGQYVVEIQDGGGRGHTLDGNLDAVGRPSRNELEYAAKATVGQECVSSLLKLVDAPDSSSVPELTSAIVRAGADAGVGR